MKDRFAAIRDALRAGKHVEDRAFDAVYPDATRGASDLHWSPIDVAACAARLLVAQPGARILDIGAGAGKFCIVAAAVCDAEISGIEHRGHLVTIAKRAAATFGVDVAFEHGSFETCDPHRFDGFYLYNPFAENFAGPGERIDDSIELNARAFARFSTLAEEFLDRARGHARRHLLRLRRHDAVAVSARDACVWRTRRALGKDESPLGSRCGRCRDSRLGGPLPRARPTIPA